MNRNFLPIYILLILFLGSFFTGCAQQPAATIYVKDGKEYGKVISGTFRHRWWNYYKRGLSYAEGKFYQESISDFNKALQQREKDQRRARTYGMHFVDYFPHRELGIVYYQMGELKKAKNELKLSLSQFPSAKAQFYLDRVRKKLIEHEVREVLPPRLTLDFKSKTIWTRTDPVVLSGIAEDDHYIKAININGTPIFLESSKKHVIFKKNLSLPQGQHLIRVEACNLAGALTRQQITLIVDREGPMIALDRVDVKEVSSGKKVLLSGSIYDGAGVAELRINGRQVLMHPGKEVTFIHQLSVDKGELEIIAKDNLGNTTRSGIPLKSFMAVNDTRTIYAMLSSDMSLTIGASIFGPQDTAAPEITLRGWTDSQTVYIRKIYLEGQVKDLTNIVSLEVNKKPILKRQGKIILFSQFIELEEGKNQITIRAQGEKGNVAEKTISIIRRIPKSLQLAERMSLTVVPFDQKGHLSEASDSFQDFFIDAIVNQNRFRVVERNKLDIILQEQKMSRTKLFDEKTALKIGRLVAAQSLIAGSIIQTRLGSEIIARMIDTETSEILAVADIYDEVTDISSLRSLSEGLAIKFHREFPLLDGVVIQKKGSIIFTDLGKDKIKIGRRLIVFREEPVKHPIKGKWMGSDNVILAHARVTQVMPELSKAKILDDKTETINRLDRVITE